MNRNLTAPTISAAALWEEIVAVESWRAGTRRVAAENAELHSKPEAKAKVHGGDVTGVTRRPRLKLARVLLIAAFVVTGCRSDNDDPPSATSTSGIPTSSAPSPPLTTTSAEEPRMKVLAAYRQFWDVFLEVGAMTGPFDKDVVIAKLRERTTGREYEALFKQFQADRLNGIVTRGSLDLAPRVATLGEETATVKDCYDDKTGAYKASTGERLDTDDPDRVLVTATLQLGPDGIWRVSAIKREAKGCVPE